VTVTDTDNSTTEQCADLEHSGQSGIKVLGNNDQLIDILIRQAQRDEDLIQKIRIALVADKTDEALILMRELAGL
jgi:hypothetical protein